MVGFAQRDLEMLRHGCTRLALDDMGIGVTATAARTIEFFNTAIVGAKGLDTWCYVSETMMLGFDILLLMTLALQT